MVKQSRSDTLYHELRRNIFRGDYAEGSKLPSERELADIYGFSRITVRDALSRLTQLGLVRAVPQSGYFVMNYGREASISILVDIMNNSEVIDAGTLLALLELRGVIELFALGRAVSRASEGDIDSLGDIVRTLEDSFPDRDRMVSADYRFHGKIVELAGNIVISLIFNSFRPVYLFYLDFFYRNTAETGFIIDSYRRVMAAMKARDENYACHIMDELLRYGEIGVKKALENIREVKLR